MAQLLNNMNVWMVHSQELTYLKTTSSEQRGHVRWTPSMASHPTLTKCNWFLECTPNLPAHPRAPSMMRSPGRSWDPFFLHRFVIKAVFDLSLLGSGNKDAGASGAVVFWQFPGNPQRGGPFFPLTCPFWIFN